MPLIVFLPCDGWLSSRDRPRRSYNYFVVNSSLSLIFLVVENRHELIQRRDEEKGWTDRETRDIIPDAN